MKKHGREGSAMIMVMCMMIVAVALSLVLLLTASILVSNATRSNNKEQCRINAVSVSDVLIEEITSFTYDETDGDGSVPPLKDASEKDTTLKGKLKTVVTSEWYAYNPNAGELEKLETKGKDYFTYELQTEGLPGETVLELYWVDETDENLKKLDMSKPSEAMSYFQSVLLYVKVTSTVGEESSTIISQFQPVVQSKSAADPTGNPETDKAWESWSWKYIGHEWERGNS